MKKDIKNYFKKDFTFFIITIRFTLLRFRNIKKTYKLIKNLKDSQTALFIT